MDALSKKEIFHNIENLKPFEGVLEDNSLYIKVVEYAPYISAAIHHGHQFRDELKEICLLDENDRYHEEDPYTGDMIVDSPIVLIPQDSRFEYDLNRNTADCIHTNAWGKEVWKKELSAAQRQQSTQKHNQFYEICEHLVTHTLKQHKHCIIYDIHSYNILDREYKNPPLFNIGTHFVNLDKYRAIVDNWMENLSQTSIKGIELAVKENEVYFGKGFLAESMQHKFKNCLVLPTEVKKIYADEQKPQPYAEIIDGIREAFKISMPKTADYLKSLK